MKVIKKQDITNWSYKHICDNCESELEVEGKDLRYNKYDGDMREPGYVTYSACCAVCSEIFTIDEKKIPRLLQIEAEKRTARSSTGYFDR
jgi:hypothetical protein